MKNRDVYELDISGIFGLLLTKWKRIAAAALAAGLLGFAIDLWVPSPPKDKMEYHQVQAAIAERKQEEENLRLAQMRLEENLLFQMKPEEILTKQMAVAAILEDPDLIRDQVDPSDLVLYAYFNLAQSQLRREILVPDVLTNMQQEQLLVIELDTENNILTVSITVDDEALADTTLAAVAQWYQEIYPEIADQTFPHRLETLSLTEAVYTQEERELLVSGAETEMEVRTSELKIAELNQRIENLLQQKEGWAGVHSVPELENAMQRKWEKEVKLVAPFTILGCCFLGFAIAVAWICIPVVAKGKILAERGLQSATGWEYIGRLSTAPVGKDPIARFGFQLLFEHPHADEASLVHDVIDMTELLLRDRGISSAGRVALIGSTAEEDLERVAECMKNAFANVQFSHLTTERVKTNRLCREADAVILVVSKNAVSMAEAEHLGSVLESAKKTLLGYILI